MGKDFSEFTYILNEQYNIDLQIAEKSFKAFSPEKLKEISENNYAVLGEICKRNKRNYKHNIGRMRHSGRRFYISKYKSHSSVFYKKAGYIEVDGGYVAVLKNRIAPKIILAFAVLAAVAVGVAAIIFTRPVNNTEKFAKPIVNEVITVGGNVNKCGAPVINAEVVLQNESGQTETAYTDNSGNFIFNDVKNGTYNLVVNYLKSTLLKPVDVNGISADVNFTFAADDLHDVEEITNIHNTNILPASQSAEASFVKALTEIRGDNTPQITVNGLTDEALLNMSAGKEVDLTLTAERINAIRLPAEYTSKIADRHTGAEISHIDFSLIRSVYYNLKLESSEYLINSKTVMEIALPYDNSKAANVYVYGNAGTSANKLSEIKYRPLSNYSDGTFYVTANKIYIYTSRFTTYTVVRENVGQTVKTVPAAVCGNSVTLNAGNGKASLMYKNKTGKNVMLKIFVQTDSGNVVVSESHEIPNGNYVENLPMKKDAVNALAKAGLCGTVQVICLTDSGTAEYVENIPVNISVIK